MAENKPITIYDIAREAEVSPATVSRVLTNSANVRKDKKDRVEALIEKYHFKPNALAKGLSDTKSKTIGMIVADIRNPYYSELFVLCEEEAKKHGYTMLVCNSLGDIELEIQQFDMLQQHQVAAIIHLGGAVDDVKTKSKYVAKLKQVLKTTPVVIGGMRSVDKVHYVMIDADKATELLMNHLLSQGHRKIAVVGGNRTVNSTCVKYRTYQNILEKYGIEFKPEYIIDGKYNYSSGYDGMNRMFDEGNIPTAVIAINDFSAAGVIRSIGEHGWKVPEDISVVSYDNTYLSDIVLPKLTSIDYNYDSYGKILVETAIAAADGDEIRKEINGVQVIEPVLIVKESSGVVKMLECINN